MTNAIQSMAAGAAESAPMQIAAFLACAAFLVGLVNQALKLVDRIKDKPAPGEVRAEAAEKFVTKSDCQKYHQALDGRLTFLDTQRVTDAKDAGASRRGIYNEVESVRKEMVDMERRINKADEDRTTGLHNRLNEILAEVSEIRGRISPRRHNGTAS